MNNFLLIHFGINLIILVLVELSRIFTSIDLVKLKKLKDDGKISEEEFNFNLKLDEEFKEQSPMFGDFEAHSILVLIIVLFGDILLFGLILNDLFKIKK